MGRRRARQVGLIVVPVCVLAALALAAAGQDSAEQARSVLAMLETHAATPSGDGGREGEPAPGTQLAAAAQPIAEARSALKRGAALRTVGDEPHAELADDLAVEWALTAREVVAALEAEHSADRAGGEAVLGTTKAERARALLEEAIARRGRLQATFDDLEREAATKSPDAGLDASGAPSVGAPRRRPPETAPTKARGVE